MSNKLRLLMAFFISVLVLTACDWKGTGPQPESGATPEGPGLLSGKDGKFIIIGD